jgi:hypothetical protein
MCSYSRRIKHDLKLFNIKKCQLLETGAASRIYRDYHDFAIIYDINTMIYFYCIRIIVYILKPVLDWFHSF